MRINGALEAVGWDPPRWTTGWENRLLNDQIFRDLQGWIGIEHSDEENRVGQAALDRLEAQFARRLE